jgi:thiol-disulfide isomerase/thioredoxin
MRKAFEVFLVLCAVFVGLFLWERRGKGDARPEQAAGEWHSDIGSLPTSRPQGLLPPPTIPPVPSIEELNRGFVEERPPLETVKPAKKHFWQRTPKNEAEEGQFAEERPAAEEDIRRRMTPREQYGLPLPDRVDAERQTTPESSYTGGKFYTASWCGYCRALKEGLIGLGFSVGRGPEFDFWECDGAPGTFVPRVEYFCRGQPIGDLRAYFGTPEELQAYAAKNPRCSGARKPRRPPQRPGNWGPGAAIRYRNSTDIGFGIGFGPQWAKPTG